MSVYIPRPFAPREPAQVARLVAEHPFATLVTAGGAEAQLSHVPLAIRFGRRATRHAPRPHGACQSALAAFRRRRALGGHIPRPPRVRLSIVVCRACGRRPDVELLRRSPAWHRRADGYRPRQARAPRRDGAALRSGARAARGVCNSKAAPSTHMLGAIVGFRLRIERVDAKFKLSQNRSVEDRERVIDGCGPKATRTRMRPRTGWRLTRGMREEFSAESEVGEIEDQLRLLIAAPGDVAQRGDQHQADQSP